MERLLEFSEEHNLLRDAAARFFEREAVPHNEQWERDGVVSKEIWLKAGTAGLLCADQDPDYGGGGGDFLHQVVIMEEMAKSGTYGPGFGLHSAIIVPYIQKYGNEAQKKRWLPGCASGEFITSIGMTEPAGGSDLQAVKTSAVRDGDHYVINGSKTFISNGQLSNLHILAARTDREAKGAKGISLIVLETEGLEGFERGRNLEKVGMHAQDTSELFFNDVRVPVENLLGEAEGQGFYQMMEMLPQERLVLAIDGVNVMELALEITADYVKDRKAFGKTIADFQNTRFKLAEMKTDVAATRTFMDHCINLLDQGHLTADDGAMAKLWATERQCKLVDECVQLHGGYGYMAEYQIARLWVNSRPQRIYGGTSEVMKDIIGRSI